MGISWKLEGVIIKFKSKASLFKEFSKDHMSLENKNFLNMYEIKMQINLKIIIILISSYFRLILIFRLSFFLLAVTDFISNTIM